MPVIIGHAYWSIAAATNILLAECRWKKDGYMSGAILTSDMSADPVPLSDMHHAQSNSIRHACWVHLFRYVCL